MISEDLALSTCLNRAEILERSTVGLGRKLASFDMVSGTDAGGSPRTRLQPLVYPNDTRS